MPITCGGQDLCDGQFIGHGALIFKPATAPHFSWGHKVRGSVCMNCGFAAPYLSQWELDRIAARRER